MQVWTGLRKGRGDRFREALSPSTTAIRTSWTMSHVARLVRATLANVLQFVHHREPEFCALVLGDPQAQHLAHAVAADAQLSDFADAIEAKQAPGGDFEHITGFASKAAEQAARISGVLTLWKDVTLQCVQSDAMADAIALTQFYLSEASRLTSAGNVSVEIEKAITLNKWLQDVWEHLEIMARDVVQFGPNSLRETPKASAALNLLEQHGWLVRLPPGTQVRGSPRKTAWRIVKCDGHVV